MICKFCGERRGILLYIYDNNSRSDLLLCAVHWNKLYYEELADQLEQNDQREVV